MCSYAPVRSRELELMILLGSFQIKIFYDSMILLSSSTGWRRLPQGKFFFIWILQRGGQLEEEGQDYSFKKAIPSI